MSMFPILDAITGGGKDKGGTTDIAGMMAQQRKLYKEDWKWGSGQAWDALSKGMGLMPEQPEFLSEQDLQNMNARLNKENEAGLQSQLNLFAQRMQGNTANPLYSLNAARLGMGAKANTAAKMADVTYNKALQDQQNWMNLANMKMQYGNLGLGAANVATGIASGSSQATLGGGNLALNSQAQSHQQTMDWINLIAGIGGLAMMA